MKKFIYLLAAVTLFAAGCDKIDDGQDDEQAVVGDGAYVGTVSVATPAYSMDNVSVKITFGKDGKAEVKMLQVKFAEKMPAMDITIPGVAVAETTGGKVLSGNAIVPIAMGGEFSAYTVTALTGTVTASNLTLSMTLGAFPTSFTGTAAE